VLRHEREWGGDRVGEEREERERFLSERGWRSGREGPEKEKWFNYARWGSNGVRVGRLTEMFKLA
jgi:hypothetical protein